MMLTKSIFGRALSKSILYSISLSAKPIKAVFQGDEALAN